MPEKGTKGTVKDSKSKGDEGAKSKAEDSDSVYTSEEDEDAGTVVQEQHDFAKLPPEYWQIQKLVKVLKMGNPTISVLALVALQDCKLEERICQLALKDNGGLDIILNLLDTDNFRCEIGALKILRPISHNLVISQSITILGGLQSLVKLLRSHQIELRCLVAETISYVACFHKAQRIVRQSGGIPYLVDLLDIPSKVLHTPVEKLKPNTLLQLQGAKCGAMALWSLSHSSKNKMAIWKAGAMSFLAKMMTISNEDVLVPVIGTLQACSSEDNYKYAIREDGVLYDVLRLLKSENKELLKHCASTIFKCGTEKETRDFIGVNNGLSLLLGVLANPENHSHKNLMKAFTGAIWKCALSMENVILLRELSMIQLFVQLLQTQPEEVLINVVGAIGLCALLPANRVDIRKGGGIEPLVNLLYRTNPDLLVNVTQCVGACSSDQDNMNIIERLDGVRLVWSLLKSKVPEVQESAAWALCPCIKTVKNAADMIRSFVGGLELIVKLLQSKNKKVQVAVCATTACIAQDKENLAVLTDYEIVNLLSALTNTTNSRLQHRVADAIAACCPCKNNRKDFGKAGAVVPLVGYLNSPDEIVRRATVHALYQLSLEPLNCVTMHSNGVVKLLLKMIADTDHAVQDAAANCLQNIRKLAMAREKHIADDI